MSVKNIIVGILFAVGLLLIFGAVGQLDFDGINVTNDELFCESIKMLIGAVLCGISIFVGNATTKSGN